MTFEEVLDQAIAMLQRRGRVTYHTLQRQFQLDDAALEDLKDALLYAHPQLRDDAGRGLIWTGDPSPAPPAAATPTATPEQTPLAYTPPYLAEKILTSRSSLEGERKQVTVLFADLKGSMELLADRDPEEARALLDPVLERMMAAVHRYEGTVNQVLGDGIMALFGAPIAHEDHAVRACYAALAMQAAVKAYAAEVQRTQAVPLHIRVGLNAGEVVVRAIGSDLHMDYTAVGQTTHLAARMEQMAMPGSILITPTVLALVEGYVQVTPLGPVPVKGLSTPVAVYEVVGVGPVRSRLQAAAARGLTRFVGRETEFEALRQALERARGGHGQVAVLVGEPGVGKSRLVYEFTWSHRTHGWLILANSSVSYGKATPFLPVIDLLKGYFQLEARDDARRLRERVTGKLLTLERSLEPTLPALLTLLDVSVEDPTWQALDPPQRRHRTLDAVKRLLLRESQVQPLLLVFEDLHWIDAETQAFLDSLVESLPTARILLLVNYRPEYQHRWGGKTYYTQLRLDPLPLVNAAELLQALVGDAPDLQPLKQQLLERTQGNPFFLEESVRTLVETEVLAGERGAYRLAKAPPSLQMPATVQTLLAARIDRLPPDEKRLLQTAAVIGTEVPLPLLQPIAEAPEEALRMGLVHLQAAEFLYEARLFPDLEYTFKHALTHEVAYGSLLQEQRCPLHARIVQVLEALAPERLAEQVERLAHHAVRGEVWDKALTYARQAGAKAAARSANREAVACFEQALAALQHLPENRDTLEQAIDLRCDLYRALYPLLEFGRSLEYLREAEPLAEALGDQRRLGWISTSMSYCLGMVGRTEHAIAVGQRAQAIAETLGDGTLQFETHEHLGRTYYLLGDYRRARDVLGRNVASGEGDQNRERFGMPDFPRAVTSRTWLASCLSDLGEFGEAIAIAEEAVRMAEAVDQPLSRIIASWGVGISYLRKGDFPRAIPALERGLEICRVWNIRAYAPALALALGVSYTLSGRALEGLPLLEQPGSRGTVPQQAAYFAGLGEAHLVAGRVDGAMRHAQHALELCQAHRYRGYEALALRLLGQIAAKREPPEDEQAESFYRQALALAEELGMRPLVAHCHFGLGTLYAKVARPKQARAELSAAIDLYRSMEMTFWLPQVEAALAGAEG